MRRRLNLKVLLALLAVVLSLGVGLYLVHKVQVRRHAAALLAQADRAEQEGDSAGEKKSLDRYLVLAPNDDRVLVRYAILLARQADSPRAGSAPWAF